MVVQILQMVFLVPGVTLLNIVTSHCIKDFQTAFLVIFGFTIVAIFAQHFIIRTFLSRKLQSRFNRDRHFRNLRRKIKNWGWLSSGLAWFLFIPYNIKIYTLTVLGLKFHKFFLPAIPFVAFHS
jgi:uncharacterized membrane protein YdjX (TVP38/TMEM64 family)